MINKVILVGNLGKDPEIRTAQSGSTVGRLTVATTDRQKGSDGQWTVHTEWHRVVCFGRLAENAGRFLRKGRQVYIEGRLRTDKWKDQAGVDRYTTEIIAEEIRFLGGGGQREGGETSRAQDGDQGSGDGGGYTGGGFGGGDEGDIPF